MSGFLPITKKEMRERGITQFDFVYVIGDAYVDHPSFGHAIISRVLEAAGAAQVVREADCDGQSLYEAAKAILHDPARMRAMRTAARGMAVVDAAERIYQTALELAR